jgi:hypothetical protein
MSERYALTYRGLRLGVELDNEAAARFLQDNGIEPPSVPPRCNTVSAEFTTRDGLHGYVVAQQYWLYSGICG